jgi:hypothetical protein
MQYIQKEKEMGSGTALEILALSKLPENQRCADCGANGLFDIYQSVTSQNRHGAPSIWESFCALSAQVSIAL